MIVIKTNSPTTLISVCFTALIVILAIVFKTGFWFLGVSILLTIAVAAFICGVTLKKLEKTTVVTTVSETNRKGEFIFS